MYCITSQAQLKGEKINNKRDQILKYHTISKKQISIAKPLAKNMKDQILIANRKSKQKPIMAVPLEKKLLVQLKEHLIER